MIEDMLEAFLQGGVAALAASIALGLASHLLGGSSRVQTWVAIAVLLTAGGLVNLFNELVVG